MKPYLLLLGATVALAACDSRPTGTQTTEPAPAPAKTHELSVAEQEAIADKVAERLATLREQDVRDSAAREAEIREQVRREVEEEFARREAQNPPPQPAQALPDRQPVAAQPVSQPTPARAVPVSSAWGQQPVGYDMFYEALTPYGVWYETANFGYVWQPTIATRNSSWRPYVDGHWADSDQGWIWVTQEPFGWATYHYGRWASLENIGWVWIPGTEWAPAWVSWREADDYVGWAPLPPQSLQGEVEVQIGGWADETYYIGPECYNFIPIVQFDAPTYRTVVINYVENVRIIERTRNVTNIYVRNSKVYLNGPRYDNIKVRCPGLVKTRPIARVDSREKLNVRENNKGDTIVVYSPKVDRKEGRPAEVSRRLENPRVRTGWEGVHDPTVKVRLQQQLGGRNTADNNPKANDRVEQKPDGDHKTRPDQREDTRVSNDSKNNGNPGRNGNDRNNGDVKVDYSKGNPKGERQGQNGDNRPHNQGNQARNENADNRDNNRRQQEEQQRRQNDDRQRRDQEDQQRRNNEEHQRQQQAEQNRQNEERQRRDQEDQQRRNNEDRQRQQQAEQNRQNEERQRRDQEDQQRRNNEDRQRQQQAEQNRQNEERQRRDQEDQQRRNNEERERRQQAEQNRQNEERQRRDQEDQQRRNNEERERRQQAEQNRQAEEHKSRLVAQAERKQAEERGNQNSGDKQDDQEKKRR